MSKQLLGVYFRSNEANWFSVIYASFGNSHVCYLGDSVIILLVPSLDLNHTSKN